MFNRASIAAAVLAVLAVSLLATTDLAGHDWDVTRFLRVGEVASARGFVSDDIPIPSSSPVGATTARPTTCWRPHSPIWLRRRVTSTR